MLTAYYTETSDVKCICMICKCGKHRCPPGAHQYIEYDSDTMKSSYSCSYVAHSGYKTERRERKAQAIVQQKFEGESTHQTDYKGHAGARPAQAARVSELLIATAKAAEDRNFQTESARYTGVGGERAAIMKPPATLHIEGAAFNGETTSREDFKAWQTQRRQAFKMADHNLGDTAETRDFMSEHKKEFSKKTVPLERRRKQERAHVSNAQFEGTTTHATDFTGAMGERTKAFVPAQTVLEVSEDRDFMTEARRNFEGRGGEAPVRVRAVATSFVSNQPFEGNTTNREDFSKKEGSRAKAYVPVSEVVHGAEDRDFQTEAGRNFTAKKGDRARIAKHGPSLGVEGRPFEGSTTAREDFKKWEGVKPRKSFKTKDTGLSDEKDNRDFVTEARNEYNKKFVKVERRKNVDRPHLTGAAFEGNSTHAMDFRKHDGARPAQAFVPHQTLLDQAEDRDFGTEARRNFDGRQGEPTQRVRAPTGNFVPGEKFDGTSTHRQDFPQWDSAPAKAYVPVNEVVMGAEDRDFQTEAGRNFTAKKGDRARIAKHGPSLGVEARPFEGSTTAREDFKKWEGVQPRKPFKTRDTVSDEKDTRDFVTEARNEYNKKFVAVERRKNVDRPHITGAAFEGSSTHATDFKRHEGAKPAQAFVPHQTVLDVAEDRDFGTEARRNFEGRRGEPAVRVKAPTGSFVKGERFEGTTTARQDFQQWDAKPAKPFVPATQVVAGAPDNRDFLSEAQQQYQAKQSDAVRARRKKEEWSATADDRNFTTEQREHLQNHGLQVRASFKPASAEWAGGERFEGSTTHRDDFVKMPLEARARVKKQAAASVTAEDRNFQTEARGNFTAKTAEIDVCPAIPLKPASVGGHTFFEQKSGKWQFAATSPRNKQTTLGASEWKATGTTSASTSSRFHQEASGSSHQASSSSYSGGASASGAASASYGASYGASAAAGAMTARANSAGASSAFVSAGGSSLSTASARGSAKASWSGQESSSSSSGWATQRGGASGSTMQTTTRMRVVTVPGSAVAARG